jgi:putative DNA primase/helicase
MFTKLTEALNAMPDCNPQPQPAGLAGVGVGTASGVNFEEVMARIHPEVRERMAQEAGPDGERSDHCYGIYCSLFEAGLTKEQVYAIAENAAFAKKFALRGDLAEDIARTWDKWEKKQKQWAEGKERLDRLIERAAANNVVPHPTATRAALKPTSQERPEEEEQDAAAEDEAEAESHEDDSAKDGLPKGYRYKRDRNGAPLKIQYYIEPKGEDPGRWVFLCSAVEFRAVTRNADGKGWGLALRIRTVDGAWNVMTISQAATAEPKLFFAALLDHGLVIAPYNKPTFLNLVTFAAFSTKNRLRCVPQVGWHEQPDGSAVFVLPDEAYGAPGAEEVVYQPQWNERHSYRRNGTLEGWQADVAKYAVGNSRIAFATATAFSGPLLYTLGIEGGGFHFVGSSSIGKTTLLRAATGVWGGGGINGGIETWRATDNALEGTAAAHCDTFLPLDEMSQASPDAVYHGAYMLSNGRGKGRMTSNATMKQSIEWRIMLLSTGEVTLADKIAERGGRPMAGQEIRIVDVPADAGCGCGIFEELHGFDQPGKLAEAIKANGSKNYGHAGRAFVNRLTDDIEGAKEQVKGFMRAFEDSVCPIC